VWRSHWFAHNFGSEPQNQIQHPSTIEINLQGLNERTRQYLSSTERRKVTNVASKQLYPPLADGRDHASDFRDERRLLSVCCIRSGETHDLLTCK